MPCNDHQYAVAVSLQWLVHEGQLQLLPTHPLRHNLRHSTIDSARAICETNLIMPYEFKDMDSEAKIVWIRACHGVANPAFHQLYDHGIICTELDTL